MHFFVNTALKVLTHALNTSFVKGQKHNTLPDNCPGNNYVIFEVWLDWGINTIICILMEWLSSGSFFALVSHAFKVFTHYILPITLSCMLAYDKLLY